MWQEAIMVSVKPRHEGGEVVGLVRKLHRLGHVSVKPRHEGGEVEG